MDLEERLRRLTWLGRLPSVVAAVGEGTSIEIAAAGHDPAPAVAPHRQYRIGSITKTMTAVLIGELASTGAVSLDDPLSRFLPGAAYPDVRLRELLSHTGNLPAEPSGMWWERSPARSRPEVDLDQVGVISPADGRHRYSNLGFGLLGSVIEEVTGRAWWEAVSRFVLEPLGMRDTTYLPEPGRHAQGFSVRHLTGELVPEPHAETGSMAAAGQVWSTIGDLVTWSRHLASPAVDALAAPHTSDGGYGLGIRLIDVDGMRWRGHTGSMPGFMASLFVEPESDRSVVVLCNATSGVDMGAMPRLLIGDPAALSTPPADGSWRPSESVPDEAAELLGWWFWGERAVELSWLGAADRLVVRDARDGSIRDEFVYVAEGWLGVSGYHDGECIEVVRDPSGLPSAWLCSTFRYTREPGPATDFGGPAVDRV